MKITAAIFSAIVFLLSVSPCCSADDCGDNLRIEQSHGHPDEGDLCSPLLACGTCTGFTTMQTAFPYFTTTPAIQRKPIPVSESVKELMHGRIWQPPRAG